MKKKYAIFLVFQAMLIFLSCGPGDFSPGRATGSGPSIEGFQGSDYGYAVYDIEKASLVMDHNPDMAFIPASVTKLFTALFALDVLGNDFVFKTEVLYTGSISDGIINGDLYIRGSGDPELTVYQLSQLARRLREKGIRGITGNFFYDESAMPGEDTLDPDMPQYAHYNSGIGALNLNRNTIFLIRRNDKTENASTYEFLPSVPSITSQVYTEKGTFPFVSYSFTQGRENWLVPEKRLLATRQLLPVKKTAIFTAWTFLRLCGINGVKLKAPLPGTAPGNSKRLCAHESRTLHEIIPDMLKNSDNLASEIIGRSALKKYNEGKNPVTFAGAVAEYFSGRFRSVNWDDFILKNASGLSSEGRLTPLETIAVLMALSKEYQPEDFLPMSGESGTLKSRLDSPDTAFKIFAKTGSIYYSSSLAGVVYGASGKRYIFAVFIDSREQRKSFDMKKVKDVNDSIIAEKWSKKASTGVDTFMNVIIQLL